MTPLTILIVDDDQDFAESIRELLMDIGHEVRWALTGEQGVSFFSEQPFDIVFMDMKLPGKNGVESFMEIRATKPEAKVVMMTGYSDQGILEQAVENGALGVLTKPFHINKMLAYLEKSDEVSSI